MQRRNCKRECPSVKDGFNPRDPEHVAAWIHDMVCWGQAVRDDIIRLEAAAGIGQGDPGDPPPEPE